MPPYSKEEINFIQQEVYPYYLNNAKGTKLNLNGFMHYLFIWISFKNIQLNVN